MALDSSNSSNLEQLALNGLTIPGGQLRGIYSTPGNLPVLCPVKAHCRLTSASCAGCINLASTVDLVILAGNDE